MYNKNINNVYMTMMTMTAMESLTDLPMLYLDVTSGVLGLILFNLVTHGRNNFSVSKYPFHLAAMVLIARVVVDFLYHSLVSKTQAYGGTTLEFVAASATWFALMYFMNKGMGHGLSLQKIATLYATTLLAMFAIARVTHWG